MKRILLLCFLLIASTVWGWAGIGFMGGSPAVDWDLLDEDCVEISDWTDQDSDTAVSEVSPAGQFRFDTNTGAAGNAIARRMKDVGSTPNTFTVEVKVYHDEIGTNANDDIFQVETHQADEYLCAVFASDGLFIRDTGSGDTEIGTNLVKESGSAEWQIWWFLVTFTGVTGAGTCDVYLDDSTHNREKVGTGINCSKEAVVVDGEIHLFQAGITTNDMVSHVDYIKIATGLHIP